MTGWGEAAFDAYLPADMVLGQADIAVVVTDRLSNLKFINDYAARLFRISGDAARLAGSVLHAMFIGIMVKWFMDPKQPMSPHELAEGLRIIAEQMTGSKRADA